MHLQIHLKCFKLCCVLGQSGGSYYDENDTSGMLNDSSILNTSVNFNVGNLKEMLKCISCHSFLFPPILQCAQGHMTCKSCFEIKGSEIFYLFHLLSENNRVLNCIINLYQSISLLLESEM